MEWVKHELQASVDITDPLRLELVTVLDRLKRMDPGDTRTVEVWKRMRDAAPKVWEKAKPVLDLVIADAVKKYLGL